MDKAGDAKLGLVAVVAIGVGGMVGGGIFAVLGLAVQLAHGGTPVAFALAGVVALLRFDCMSSRPTEREPRCSCTSSWDAIASKIDHRQEIS